MPYWMWPLSSADALRQLSLGPETILSRWSAKVGMTHDILIETRGENLVIAMPGTLYNPLSSAE
jgi:hypothetical protein